MPFAMASLGSRLSTGVNWFPFWQTYEDYFATDPFPYYYKRVNIIKMGKTPFILT